MTIISKSYQIVRLSIIDLHLEDFIESAIIEDGVIFASPADKESFEAKHAQDYRIKGNVFIKSGN